MSRLSLISALLLICSPVFAQRPSPHAVEFVRITKELRLIGVPSGSWGRPVQPPVQVPPLLHRLNATLRELIAELLDRRGPPGLQRDFWDIVVTELERAGWEEVPRQKWAAYGELDSVEAEGYPDSERKLLVVTTKLWVPCGGSDPDTMVYVFEKRATQWRLVLQVEGDYEPRFDGNDGLGFQVQLSPLENDGSWFLAVAAMPPVCDERPLSVTCRILRPGEAPEKPVEILKKREDLFPKAQPPYSLRTESDWFSITRPVLRRLDGEPGILVSRWRIKGNTAERAFPLAEDPEDFLDHWIQLSWEEAQRWSAKAALPSLGDWHAKLNRILPGSVEITFVQSCKAEGWKEQWQVGLYFDLRGQEILGVDELFAVVIKERRVFRLDSIHRERPSGCPGETPPREKLLTLR